MTIRCPHAEWDLLGEQTQPKMTDQAIFCLHTMGGGTLEGVRAMFKAGGFSGTESHFGVGGDGKAYQWQDLEHTADANYYGNPYVISVETEDAGSHWDASQSYNDRKLTAKQLDKLVDIATWCSRKFDIPPVLIPDTQAGRRGFAYHRQGITGNWGTYAYPGFKSGLAWSTSGGKICPGDARIEQLVEVIIPLVRKELAPDHDYRVRASKDGRTKERVFERARKGLRTYVMDLVRDDWRVVVRKVRDQD